MFAHHSGDGPCNRGGAGIGFYFNDIHNVFSLLYLDERAAKGTNNIVYTNNTRNKGQFQAWTFV
jgi:hypothetical protein